MGEQVNIHQLWGRLGMKDRQRLEYHWLMHKAERVAQYQYPDDRELYAEGLINGSQGFVEITPLGIDVYTGTHGDYATPADDVGELAEPLTALRQQLEQARNREADLRAALAEAQKFMATLPDGIGEVLDEHFAEAPEFWEWHQGAMWAVDDALKRAALRETGTPGDEAGEGERGL